MKTATLISFFRTTVVLLAILVLLLASISLMSGSTLPMLDAVVATLALLTISITTP